MDKAHEVWSREVCPLCRNVDGDVYGPTLLVGGNGVSRDGPGHAEGTMTAAVGVEVTELRVLAAHGHTRKPGTSAPTVQGAPVTNAGPPGRIGR